MCGTNGVGGAYNTAALQSQLNSAASPSATSPMQGCGMDDMAPAKFSLLDPKSAAAQAASAGGSTSATAGASGGGASDAAAGATALGTPELLQSLMQVVQTMAALVQQLQASATTAGGTLGGGAATSTGDPAVAKGIDPAVAKGDDPAVAKAVIADPAVGKGIGSDPAVSKGGASAVDGAELQSRADEIRRVVQQVEQQLDMLGGGPLAAPTDDPDAPTTPNWFAGAPGGATAFPPSTATGGAVPVGWNLPPADAPSGLGAAAGPAYGGGPRNGTVARYGVTRHDAALASDLVGALRGGKLTDAQSTTARALVGHLEDMRERGSVVGGALIDLESAKSVLPLDDATKATVDGLVAQAVTMRQAEAAGTPADPSALLALRVKGILAVGKLDSSQRTTLQGLATRLDAASTDASRYGVASELDLRAIGAELQAAMGRSSSGDSLLTIAGYAPTTPVAAGGAATDTSATSTSSTDTATDTSTASTDTAAETSATSTDTSTAS